MTSDEGRVKGYNRSGFRVGRLKLAPDPEPRDVCTVKCTKTTTKGLSFFRDYTRVKVALAGQQRHRTPDDACFRFQYNVTSLRLSVISVGAAFQPR